MSLSQSKRWMWFLLPANLTAQGLITVLPLYVIFLGGYVGEVSIVIALYYAASAIGAIFWGKVIDRFHIRRGVLLITLSVIFLCCIWLYSTKSISLLFVISSIIGFFTVGKNSVTQLLVMESGPKNQWSWLFARTSIISTFGMLAATIIGTISSVYFSLAPYFLICAASTAIAIAFSTAIKGAKFHLERSSIAHSIHGLRYSISSFHFFVFPKIPELYDFKHIITIFKGKVSHEIGILFVNTFVFYFGSNMYFTAFTPFLKNLNFSDSSVFLIYMIQTAVMIAIFFVAPRVISKLGEERATSVAYGPRIAAVLVVSFTPLLFGVANFAMAIVSACLMVIAFSIYSTSTSVILFKSIPQGFEGKYLGVNSSVTGVAVFGGALVTGHLTNLLGYSFSFLVSAVILAISFVLFRTYLRYRLSNKIF